MPAPATEPCWCRDRFVADQDQYLRVCYRDGRKEHIRGPCFKFRDPILHTSITTLDAICLDAFEAVVVYQETCRSPDGAALAPAGAQLPTVLPAHGLSLCSHCVDCCIPTVLQLCPVSRCLVFTSVLTILS